MKNNRQNVIMSIIQSKKIRTHEQLISELSKKGYNVTQATISRDIKVLGLTKLSDSQGAYYGVLNDTVPYSYDNYVVSVNYGGNIIVVKTRPAAASAVASTLDNMLGNEILGTIAGDDTIFVAVKNADDAKSVCERLRNHFFK